MSPPIVSPHNVFSEMMKPDCQVSQSSQLSETSNFSCNFAAAGFNYSKIGPEKSNLSTRSRPRLMKMRRKQVGSQNGISLKLDLGLNGFKDASNEVKLDGKVGNVSGDLNGNSESNMSTKQFGDIDSGGLGLCVNLSMGRKNSPCGTSTTNSSSSNLHSRDANFLFASNEGSSNVNARKENWTFSFGTSKTGYETNQDLQSVGLNTRNTELGSECITSGISESNAGLKSSFSTKECSGDLRQPKVDEFKRFEKFEFVFGSEKYESSSNVNLDKHDSNITGRDLSFEDFINVNSSSFVFDKTVDQQKRDCRNNRDKDESVKENQVPDVMDKTHVKLNTYVRSEVVFHPSFKFPANLSSEGRKDHVHVVFGSKGNEIKVDKDLEGQSSCKDENRFTFTNSGQGNTGVEMEFQNARFSDAFVFGASKGKMMGVNTGGSNVIVNESNQVNGKTSEDSNGFSTSGVLSEKDLECKLSNEMMGLNIDGANEKQNLSCNCPTNASNGFVFGRKQASPGSKKEENQPSANTSDVNLSRNNAESYRTPSSLSSSIGIHVQLNAGFHGVKGEKEEISSTSNLDGLLSSGVDCSTPNISFSNFGFAPGVDTTLYNANGKFLRSKRLKKTNKKLGKTTLVHDLFGKNQSSIGSSKQNSESPVCGSPMHFSPYQYSTSSNAPAAGREAGNENFASDEKGAAEHCESPHDDGSNSKSIPSLPAQDGLSAIRQQYKKKYKLKVGSNKKVQDNHSIIGDANQRAAELTILEACEHWRIRGNQAYHNGKLSEAEEFYSMGIDSVPHASTVGHSVKPLLLCYSNRAATRMTLGRLREAIDDCTKAAALDSDFLKATLRAANCYLILGEVDDAINCYNKCLGSIPDVCLDRRVTIESADGLLKAKRVAEYICQSAKLLQEGTHDAASTALENIAEALSISRYSEKLLAMKGEALCILRMYDEVIDLCDKTLHIAKRNFSVDYSDDANCENSHLRSWRWHLQTKCYYHLGKLDLALDMIEQEKVPASSKSGDMNQDSSTALAASIRELSCLKKSGNEAFHSGRYAEAVEHYTAAISKSVESRPFMAICLCNRAAAYQSMNQIIDAIADCSLAIALDENYQKAISRRATLHEMIRDYKQAVGDLQRLIPLLENQSQTKTQQHNSQGRSSGGSVRDLRKARRQISLMEDKAKKDISLDLYLILGIKASDTESEIKKAYRKAALRHHPDKASQVLVRSDVGDAGTLWKEVGEKIHNDADRLFKVIGEAYAVLSDPSKRSKYDNEEELRNVRWDSNRNSNSGHPSTSYSSPYGKGNSPGRHTGYGTERNNRRWHWYNARSYEDSPYSRW